MALIRDLDDTSRDADTSPLDAYGVAACGITLSNPQARILGTGRPRIFTDTDARILLGDAALLRQLVTFGDEGKLVVNRASPRLGRTCSRWFGVFPNIVRQGGRPMAFSLVVLEEYGVVAPLAASRIYAAQRSAEERAANVASMDRTLAQADRDDKAFDGSRPGFWDYFWGEAKELLSSTPAIAVAAAVVVGLVLVRR